MNSVKRRIILMGTGPFAVPSFEAIRAAGHEVPLVITRPRPPVKSRRGPPPAPVHDWAVAHGLPLESPDSINEDAVVQRLAELEADLMVVCDYGQILRPAALATTRWGGINLHGSLLPAYRGAAPVQRAVLSGDLETGVSVIHMTPRLDGGPILATRRTPIGTTETSGELEERLSAIGVQATIEAIELLDQSLVGHDPAEPLPTLGAVQDPARVSKAPRLHKAEAEIDWSRSARHIDCLVRGMQPWPIAYTFAETKPGKPPVRLAIVRVTARPDAAADDAQIGHLLVSDTKDEMAIGCGDGRIIVERLQPAGKKEMDAAEFIRGHRLQAGFRFGMATPTENTSPQV
ncbi:methionyl-tRNA formyltransferase [Allorhodopirellula heiligendammensis]|uniref:Methionyl-tRNA formyltransferase n=1 Tax=Allorhodopirellula heiligendammensis TaxID=2714739 RepID=A0A5C6C1V1_9BACT|nr:methionyl-tRNA formyltransferase [Allorhodopirellula heiligendammensis]TWU17967.1 Methionyl-tRNA formyltransferase [Allorhodopirellula heiligendammensis]